MDLAPEEEIRAVAYDVLWDAARHAASMDADARECVLVWLAMRSDDEGGFLWVAGQLGRRPSVIAAALQSIVAASGPKRQAVRLRLKRGGVV
jgi:hypothetical protein